MPRAISIAREFLRLSQLEGETPPLTNLRLHNLLYYAQGWSIILRETDLFPEEMQAWRCGPVVPEINVGPRYRGDEAPSWDRFSSGPEVQPDEIDFLKSLWESYREISKVSPAKMDLPERPWKLARGNRSPQEAGSDPIDIAKLEEDFAARKVPEPLAKYKERFNEREEAARQALAARPPLDMEKLLAKTNKQPPRVASK